MKSGQTRTYRELGLIYAYEEPGNLQSIGLKSWTQLKRQHTGKTPGEKTNGNTNVKLTHGWKLSVD